MQLKLNLFDRCSDTFKGVETDVFGVEPNLECQAVRICCGQRPDWSTILRQSGGYHLPQAETIVDVPDLPEIIHSVKGDQSHRPYLPVLEKATWAVPYSRALGGNLENTGRLQEWLRHQKLASENLILLHQETKDDQLERLFLRTFHPNFFRILGSAPNCVSISPGYSVYDNGSMCRHHQLYNLKRSIEFFVRACKHGLPCIPSFGWNLKEDLDRIADWLNLHPTLRYIAINCQTIRASRFGEISEAMHHIEGRARPLRWVIFGGPKVSKYLNADGFAGRIHLVTSAHLQAARAGRNLDNSYHLSDNIELVLHNHKMIADTFSHPSRSPYN